MRLVLATTAWIILSPGVLAAQSAFVITVPSGNVEFESTELL